MTDLGLIHDHAGALRVTSGGVELFQYVYRPADDQVESPRPYLHPIRTLGGRLVSIYRPHDHVWHKGLSLALSNVAGENFWGGPTYLRDLGGYAQLPNNGTQRHDRFDRLDVTDGVLHCVQDLTWTGQDGRTMFAERRGMTVTVLPSGGAWRLGFETSLRNVSGGGVTFGSPQTEGRDGAPYSGLFWRGPRSFSGGTVRTAAAEGTDDLNGVRAPWMSFTGRHDEDTAASTILFVDDPGNPRYPTAWFVRSEVFAVMCPALFADAEYDLPDGDELRLRYSVVVADGDPGRAGCTDLAQRCVETGAGGY